MRDCHRYRAVTTLALLLCVHATASASVDAAAPQHASDAPAQAQRPRVGLVLSGGGARGAAHIGVIRALEELQIPIDAVVGTSMGAVVGGLYASGLSGAQIEAVFAKLDWQEMFRDRAPRRELVYRRKQDDRSYLVDGALGVRDGAEVVFPLGLIQGQKIAQVLRAATLQVGSETDFDRLATPFRALATDLETGEPVVLAQGDLATVMRASMSAPGVFAPVEIDGRLLVDGGLVDNLPVDLGRSLGVDRLIVVDVSFPLAARAELGSALDVTNQMIGIMIRRDTLAARARLRPEDLLVEPDLGRLSSLDFERVPQVMYAGRAAVERLGPQLAELSLGAQDWSAHQAQRQRHGEQGFAVEFVRPGPKSAADAARIDAVFGDLVGEDLQGRTLSRRLGRVYGLDRYESVDFRQVRAQDGSGLELDLRRKSWGPNFLRFGLSLEQDYDGGATVNAAARLLMTGLNRYDAEWLNEVQLGDDPRLYTELFQPLSLTSDWFVAPSLRYELRGLQVVDGQGRRVARYRVRETEAALAVGAQLSDWGEARVGVRRGDGSTRVQIGDPGLPSNDFDLGGWFLEFGYDRLDSVDFPRDGQALRLRWLADEESFGASGDAQFLEGSFQVARSIDRLTLIFSADAGSALDDRVVSPQDLYTLGGFLNLSGLPSDARIGTQYGIGRVVAYKRVSRGGTGVFEFPAYLGASLEAGAVWPDRDAVALDDLELGGSLFLGADSPLGPLYFAAGLGEDGERAFYLVLGKTF
jgi:NTE family protein